MLCRGSADSERECSAFKNYKGNASCEKEQAWTLYFVSIFLCVIIILTLVHGLGLCPQVWHGLGCGNKNRLNLICIQIIVFLWFNLQNKIFLKCKVSSNFVFFCILMRATCILYLTSTSVIHLLNTYCYVGVGLPNK